MVEEHVADLPVGDRLQIDGGPVAALLGEVAGFIEHVGDAAAHAGGEVAAGLAEHDDQAVGHVFAAVIAEAFDDGAWRRSCGRRSVRRPRR